MFNKQVFSGLIRHVVTTFGGVMVANGYVTDGQLEILGGAAAIIFGCAWSAIDKKLT